MPDWSKVAMMSGNPIKVREINENGIPLHKLLEE